ncbi:hypothetical protein D3C87_256650 [compost metagenome]
MHSFKTFIPIEQVRYRAFSTPGEFIYFMWSISLISLGGTFFTENRTHDLLYTIFWFAFLLGLLVKIISFFIKKRERAITGEIIFEKDKITVNGVKYLLYDLNKIIFSDCSNLLRKGDGYFDKNTDIEPNSKDNVITLELNNGETLRTYFQLNTRYHIRNIQEELIHYHNESKVHFLNLIDILGIEDYNAIQHFKQKLPGKGKY